MNDTTKPATREEVIQWCKDNKVSIYHGTELPLPLGWSWEKANFPILTNYKDEDVYQEDVDGSAETSKVTRNQITAADYAKPAVRFTSGLEEGELVFKCAANVDTDVAPLDEEFNSLLEKGIIFTITEGSETADLFNKYKERVGDDIVSSVKESLERLFNIADINNKEYELINAPKVKMALSIPTSQVNLPVYQWVPVLLDRATCEKDVNYVQIIPYIVLHDEKGCIFTYTRGKKGYEDRLHDLLSIGIGGHIEFALEDYFGAGNTYPPASKFFADAVAMAISDTVNAETFEETGYEIPAVELLEIQSRIRLDLYQKIYLKESNNPVDQRHIGIVVHLKVKRSDLTKLEDGTIINPQWLDKENLLYIAAGRVENQVLENWSEAVIRSL